MRLSLRRFGTLGGTVTPTFTNGIKSPSIQAISDSTMHGWKNAAGTNVLTVDTTNGRIGVNVSAPSYALQTLAGAAESYASYFAQNKAAMNVGFDNDATASTGNTLTFEFRMRTDVASRTAFRLTGGYTSITDASRTSYISFVTNTAGAFAEVGRFSGNKLGVGVTSPTAFVHTAASTTAVASLCMPHGAAPTSPVDGDMWTTTAGLFVRINGATVGPLT